MINSVHTIQWIIYNRGNHPDELDILYKLDNNVKNNLIISLDQFGFIFDDKTVVKSIQERQALLVNYPESSFANDINIIADRIVRLWDKPLEDTNNILYKISKKIFDPATLYVV